MAGSMSMIIANDNLEKHTVTAAATRDQWHQIHFSRFFTFPNHSHHSMCPTLAPPSRRSRGGSSTGGTWISTSSPTASLLIFSHQSPSDSILTVCFRDKILEEHYVSKLHFSWPQVSCVSGYPARGSRTLFASYLDSAGWPLVYKKIVERLSVEGHCSLILDEIQKFALRFPTIYEAEAFVNALNEILKADGEPAPLNSDFPSEISSHSGFMSSNRLPTRAHEEESSIMDPIDTYIPQLPPSFNCEVEQASCAQETMLAHNFQGVSPSLPPSFTSLLANCRSELNPDVGATQLTLPEEVDLKSQILKYMEDSSFHDMLFKVEKVMEELGGDLIL